MGNREWDKRSKLTMVAEKVNLTPGGGSKNGSSKPAAEKVGAGAAEEVPF